MPAASARQSRSVEATLADGRRLHARVWPGDGVPLVLLHGMLDSSEGWTDVCRAAGRPCVAFDLPGFGRSDMPSRPSLRAYAEDVIEGMEALRIDEAVLLGHSLGGGVAAAVAERDPGRVLALLLLAPAGFGRIALAEVVSIPGIRNVAERLLPFALGSRQNLATVYRAVITNGVTPADDILDRVVSRRDALAPAAREATKAIVRAGASPHGFGRRRHAFAGPVVAVWGDCDRVVPLAHMAGVSTAFPHVEEHVWGGMGHHHKVERPAALGELIEATCVAFDAEPALAA
jgi:pyruvate dehydrogenase E2 component (dihydrolipoamide acetyltransferase)